MSRLVLGETGVPRSCRLKTSPSIHRTRQEFYNDLPSSRNSSDHQTVFPQMGEKRRNRNKEGNDKGEFLTTEKGKRKKREKRFLFSSLIRG